METFPSTLHCTCSALDQSLSQPLDQSLTQLLTRSTSHSSDHLTNQSSDEPIKQSINQANISDQSVDRSIHQSNYKMRQAHLHGYVGHRLIRRFSIVGSKAPALFLSAWRRGHFPGETFWEERQTPHKTLSHAQGQLLIRLLIICLHVWWQFWDEGIFVYTTTVCIGCGNLCPQ